jgi:hypothetical protein
MRIWGVPSSNWGAALADIVDECQDGDTIIVRNESMKELAERAIKRLYPDKKITIQIMPQEERYV